MSHPLKKCNLFHKWYEVTVVKKSIEQIRLGIKTPLIFNHDRNCNYWVILELRSPEDNYYLVPKANLIINDRIYQTVEDIFVCEGYENRASNKFKLIYPAEVKFIRNNEWELLNLGKLRFDIN